MATPTDFKKLSKKEKRIAIAIDVYEGIADNIYLPEPERFIDRNYIIANNDANKSLQSLLLNNEIKNCEVCALGACFLSLVKFENKLTVKEFSVLSFNESPESSRSRLAKYFTKKQMALIETAFENMGAYGRQRGCNENSVQRALRFHLNHNLNNEYLLNAIMENIIDNKGTFKP